MPEDKQCEKCKNKAKYKILSFLGNTTFVCGVHVKKYKNKICYVVYYKSDW